jgi:hypothetical protein
MRNEHHTNGSRIQPIQDGPPENRWLHWAQWLVRRFEVTPLRYGQRTLAFLEPLMRMVHVSNRWEQHSLAMLPQIRLAISPVIYIDWPIWERDVRRVFTEGVGTGQGDKNQAVTRLADKSSRQKSRDAAPTPVKPQKITHPGIQPLQRVFRRIKEMESVTHSVKRQSIANESIDMGQRVLYRTQRLEERREPTRVIDMNRQSIRGQGHSADPTRFDKETPPTRPQTVQQAPSPVSINIENLTDQVMRQIDRRMLSWRERRGRT